MASSTVQRSTRRRGFAVLALGVLVGLTTMVAALLFGGGAAPLAVGDPGALVRWGYPVARFALICGLAIAVGGLVFTCFALVPGKDAWNRVLDIAALATGVATLGAAGTSWTNFRALVSGELSVSESFTAAFRQYFFELDAGRVALVLTISLALLTVVLLMVRQPTPVAFALVAFSIPIGAIAAAGHQGGTENHTLATSGLFVHVLFASVWVGGLAVLCILRFTDAPSFATAAERYSTLALFSAVVVTLSGIVSALVRAGWDGIFTTPYGALVLVKTCGLLVLVAFGAVQRRRLLPAVREGRTRAFMLSEIVVMLAVFGVSVALARTPTPIPQIPAEGFDAPSRILTGQPLPPPFEPWRLITEWYVDPIWMLVAVCMAVFYLWGVWRLHRRGDRWPVHRTIFWLAGTALFVFVTSGGLNVYQQFFFSWHMLAHMLLGLWVPVLLVPGAPITLALRAIRPRKDGSIGPREWLLRVVHSKYMAAISGPVVASAIFLLSMWVFYYTPLIEWAMVDHLGHLWMVAHFSLAGYLWVSMLLSIDPMPHKPPFPLRMLVLLATMAGHAFFGVTIMMNQTLIAPDFFGALGNGVDALHDQRVGGGLAWSVGEIPTVIIAIVMVVLWSRSDAREAKRHDRQAARDGDAELAAYNQMLAEMAERDRLIDSAGGRNGTPKP